MQLRFLFSGGILGLFAFSPFPLRCWEFPATKDRLSLILEVEPGFLYLGPSSHVSVLYQVDSSGNLTDPFGNTTKIDWEPAVGMRARAEVLSGNRQSAEFLYTGLYNWTRHKSVANNVTGVGLVTAPYTTVDWQDSAKIKWSTKTSYNSYEVTFWYHVAPRYEDFFSFSTFAGIRFINIVDTDLFFSFKTIEFNEVAKQHPSVCNANTDNWLRGGEIGLEIACRPLSFMIWGAQGRGAVFADTVERSIYLTDLSNSVVVANTIDSPEKTVTSGLGEFLPFIIFQNNRFFFKIVGQYTYLGEIGLTVDSFSKVRKITHIYVNNDFSLAGGYLGVGYIF